MRPILVAGKNGQLARALLQVATRRGVPLVTIGRPAMDLNDKDSIESAADSLHPGLIVNAAAYTAVDRAEAEPNLAYSVNRDGAARLARTAERLQIPFIHVSTDFVFDGRNTAPYREEDAPGPLGVYGQSKLDGEYAVLSACRAAVVLRTSWLYSPWGTNFVNTMIKLAQTRDQVRVVDDQHGTPTAALDVAGAILDIGAQIKEPRFNRASGLYHVSATGETTWYGFAKAIFDNWASRGRHVPSLAPISTAEYPSAALRPANSRLDCTKLERELNIRLPHWRDSLDRCLAELATAPMETYA